MSEWKTDEHVGHSRRLTIPHKHEGERVLLEVLPPSLERVLDLGTGDGHILALVLDAVPGASGVGVDFSPPMLTLARDRFDGVESVTIVEHDLGDPLPDLGSFDAVVSGFAIHHLFDERKQTLLGEIVACLRPGGVFANLEHVASPTPRLQRDFYDALGLAEGDPSNRLVAVEPQLTWMRAAGLDDVDCLWKWRELALLAGRKPA